MVLADNSYAEKLRRLRGRTLAIYHRNALAAGKSSGFYPVEQGVGGNGVDQSTRISRAYGQIRYTSQGEYQTSVQSGASLACPTAETNPCCCVDPTVSII